MMALRSEAALQDVNPVHKLEKGAQKDATANRKGDKCHHIAGHHERPIRRSRTALTACLHMSTS